ncbi:MAG: amidohydrolase family protein [Betaproteobacteria bacterium]|nr:amidohydrolase family protein [Betaproteobacteria bacterium]
MAYDLLIKNAQIIDGTGAPAFSGDVAVKDGVIADVGKVTAAATRVIDAQNQVLSPGFVDAHTHMDAQLLWDPLATSSCWHGVTSLMIGNCSFSVAPCRPEDRGTLLHILERVEGMSLKALNAGVDWSWESFPEYMKRIDRKLGLNVATLMGYSAVRQYAMGGAASDRAATPEEIASMQKIVRDGLAAGAYGVSFNFNKGHSGGDGRPVPSRLAPLDEVLAIADALRGSQTAVIQVNDNPCPDREPLDVCEDISMRSGRPVWWIPLLQFFGQPGVWKKRLDHSARQVASGSKVRAMSTSRTIDVVFNMRNAHIFDTMNAWRNMLVKKPEEVIRDMRDPAVRAALQKDIDDPSLKLAFSRRWDMVEVVEVSNPKFKVLEHRKIADLAKEQGRRPIDVFLDLCVDDTMDTLFLTILANGDEAAAAEILTAPHTLIGLSDAGAHAALECGYGFTTYLLGHWVRDKKIMPIEEAVRKLSSMHTDQMGLTDRGRIRPGQKADINVFDPATIEMLHPVPVNDFPAGARRYIQKARGISYTLVNGQVLMENGEHTGAYPGHLLRGR